MTNPTDSGDPDVEQLRRRLHEAIPGGCHTYAKGDDQFPVDAPALIARGRGCHVWDLEGREYIEYGMGLRSVTLGHAFSPVVDAVRDALALGTNFSRPSPMELDCAETFLRLVPTAEMVKFCKDGSHAVDGAIRLARAHTGREIVAACAEHPFFSTGDWFIGTTPMSAGIPEATRRLVLPFRYNDLDALRGLFAQHPGQIACVIMEAARLDEPAPGYLAGVRDLVHANGALLVFDEMITGFRWNLHGAQHEYGVTPDLSAFGKAIANGFSVSAIAGRREIMQLGGSDHDRDRVFLLSTTHGAETHQLAAAIATMSFHESNPVIETLAARGARLRAGFDRAARASGVEDHVALMSRDCNLLFATRDQQKAPSQPFRTLFMQQLLRHGVIAPSFVVSYSHSEQDIDHTIDAIGSALGVYRKALDEGVDKYLVGRPVKPAFRRRA
ncbi:MAG: glutamate-semialdehyde -aminomutase [Panacagrimonas sp.]|jgi:glutamate-1-semialdehyde 2,1-aminomutase|nr:glutamate-1-semialdehyde 2,1-aminomutase [Panacagrimonas sp.]MCC2658642.1 glutamate-semialdehyde -aminomutase [Panacagrimonas sp.]